VTLDGSHSSDVDGDALSFSWSLTSVPLGSAASLDDPTSPMPSLDIDEPGTYVAQLIVNDGTVDSDPDTVTVTTENSAPVADAGLDQSVRVGDTVTLDGTGSSDADHDPLTFDWAFTTRPAGSGALLSDPTAPMPVFTVDLRGTYVVQLIVHDGTVDSTADTVVITTENLPPVADAGPDQAVAVTDTVSLDGSASFDPDLDPLTFDWSFLSIPAGSAATLSDRTAVDPSFTADLPGIYVVQLIVNDGTVDSPPDTVVITAADNEPPVADAGPDQNVATGATVQLDGSGSSDPDGASISSFSWSLVSRPAGSAATLSDPSTVAPTFVADQVGTYVAELIVNDGALDSAPDTVVVTVEDGADLSISFFLPSTPTNPPVGSVGGFFVIVRNGGPASTTDVTARAPLPAGYTFSGGGPNRGTYDAATGNWTIGSLDPGQEAHLNVAATVNATGPYDLTVDITGSSQPDPDLTNNAATVIVTPNPNADLGVAFFNPPAGTFPYGAGATLFLVATNSGPASTTGVVVHFPVPAGFTVVAGGGTNQGTYDLATGTWAIGTMLSGGFARLDLRVTVNPTGPVGLNATITGSSQPDPNLSNNTAAPAPLNRPPAAHAGLDQAVGTNSPVALDGSGSGDPDGDAVTQQWVLAIRPASSAATLANASTLAPSFIPDRGGRYVAQLTLTDSHGVASAPDTATILAEVLNLPPAIRSTPITTAAVDQAYRYDVEAADPDAGDTLTFSLVTAPAGMTIDAATGVVQWTPSDTQGGPHSVSLRVQDAAGLFATQAFLVQVSSTANQAPVALDDAYEVRAGESLGVGTPGVLDNDSDADGAPLSATLLSGPENGELSFNPDGSFTYTPHTLGEGALVLAEDINLATRLPGAVVSGSGEFGTVAAFAADDDLGTSWRASPFDTAPFVEVSFPQAVTVTELSVFGHREPFLVAGGKRNTAGFFQLFAADGTELFNSGGVDLPAPMADARHAVGTISGVRRARFTVTAFNGEAGLAEFKMIGSALIRRPLTLERNLGLLLPTVAQTSSPTSANPAESAIDDTPQSNWYAGSAAAGEFLELAFPIDVTVTELQTANPSARPDGSGTSLGINCSGNFALLDANGAVLFDSGVVNEPSGALFDGDTFTLPVPNVSGVRRVRYTSAGCGPSFPPGFSELRVFGSAPVAPPAFGLARKFHALVGREAHSTPIVANLSDDNGDGRIDTHDIPDIVMPVENLTNQMTGELKIVSGDDGRELFTAGGPDLVSPWSEAAAGDLDGDGVPEIVAVHSDGSHLIAFDNTGAVRWLSDSNPMPRYNTRDGVGNPVVFMAGAVSIANLDGQGPPEIVVGASVFDSQGALLGDGRTLGGTTSNIGRRSAISAVVDLDLDGLPEILAGPTAYRLDGGALTKVWQRTDRPDGYVAVANFDDDPFPEIVIVGCPPDARGACDGPGRVYMLNHDGTDASVWNPPTHAPIPLPGGGDGGAPTIADLDGDGIPEIGIASSVNYLVFHRDGSIRWQSAIEDRSSHSTGSTVFDLDSDGGVEVIYRDEMFLRVYRGADGVLLARVPLGSSTWAEGPVVVDVDNDGHGEIVVSSDRNLRNSVADSGIHVLEDIADKWARTRRIWNQHAYHVTNVNEDGTIPPVEPPHWLLPGLNNFRLNAFLSTDGGDRADRFTYAVDDGVLTSNVATVSIAVRAPNSTPSIVSSPVTTAAADVLYTYAAQAADPDSGDILSFSLPEAPAGMTVDSFTGLIHWTPSTAQRGRHDVVVKVEDVRGAFALQGYAVEVSDPVTVPDVVGQAQATAEATITAATLAVGAIGTRNSPTAPTGSVLSQSPAAGTLVAPGSPVGFVVSLGPAPLGTVPDVLGQTEGSAGADIVAAGFLVGAIAGQHHATVPLGVVLGQDPAGGTQATAGSAVNLVVSLGEPPEDLDSDGDGFTGNEGDCNDTDPTIHPGAEDVPGNGIDENCNGADSIAGDDTPPTASILSPADGAVILMPADIIGIATDDNFLRYRLEFGSADAVFGAVLASGTSPVVNAPLGRLDPTLLENGLYRARLIVEDVNGGLTVDERVYRVSGEAKPGVFRVSFLDLEIALGGIPIKVIRTYDSRVKTSRDFGFGWTMDIQRARLQHNRTPGDGWQVLASGGPLGLPCQLVVETKGHVTEVRFSDVDFYVFQLELVQPAPVVGGCVAEARYRQIAGFRPGATLEIIGGTQVFFQGGGNEVIDLDTGNIYDPGHALLTLPDGTEVELDRAAGGVTRIETLNGDAIQFLANGIVHSSGVSVALTRDAQGRLTRITDPRGAALVYAYDGAGDLRTVTDRDRTQTSFSYDNAHFLLEIDRPDKKGPVEMQYDAEGRLIAVVNADGTRRAFTHDIVGRTEIVADAAGHQTITTYNDRGDVLREEDALGHVTTWTVDGDGNELSKRDALGNLTTWTYDANGNKTSETDAAGNTQTWTYGAFNKLTSETDKRGNTTTYQYDSRANLTRIVDRMGFVTTHAYNTLGQLISTTCCRGFTTHYAYDRRGLRTAQTDALGSTTQYAYDGEGNQISELQFRTTASGREAVALTRIFDSNGLPLVETDGEGSAESKKYAPNGLPSQIIDRNGNTIVRQYADTGNLLERQLHPDGSASVNTFDVVGNMTSTTDRDGNRYGISYDALGRLTDIANPDGTRVQLGYDALGRISTAIDDRGNSVGLAWDAFARQTGITDALGGLLARVYDANGNLIRETDQNGNVTQHEYDAADRRVRTIYADGSQSTTQYLSGCGDEPVAINDANGRTTSFEYDALTRLVAVVDALGQRTEYGYDEVGNRIVERDANGRITRLEYDNAGRVVKRTLPLGQFETFAYDGKGNVTARTDFLGRSTAYIYDADDLLVEKRFPDGSTVDYTYTPAGLRVAAGGETRVYDARGRVLSESKASGEVISYTYDSLGNRASVTTSAQTVTYGYDAANRLVSVTSADGTTAFGYDAAGNRTSVTRPNGASTLYTHDARNRVTQIQHFDGTGALASSFAYTLGAAGERLRVTESGPATRGRVAEYSYDAVYRLVEERIDEPGTQDDRRIEYAYDAVGNRLTRRVTIGTRLATTTYSYDANDRLTAETTEVAPASAVSIPPPGLTGRWLRLDGDVAALGHASLAIAVILAALLFAAVRLVGSRPRWASAGGALAHGLAFVAALGLVFQPIEVLAANPGFYLGEAAVAAPASTALAAEAVTYTYDDNGNLVARTGDNGMADTFTYDFENRMVAAQIATGPQPASVTYAYDADGLRTQQIVNGVVTDYLFDKGVRFGQLALARSQASAVAYVYGDDLVSQTHTSGGASYFHADGNMSIRHLSNPSGATSDTFTYDAFGILLDRTGSTPNEFRYAGEQYDPNAGFYYLRARYYQPGNGRFTARDPWIGNPMEPRTLHKYVYANSSPTMFRDPAGMFTLSELTTSLTVVGILAGLSLAQLFVGGVVGLILGASKAVHWQGTSFNLSVGPVGTVAFSGTSDCGRTRIGMGRQRIEATAILLGWTEPIPFGITIGASQFTTVRGIGRSSVAFTGFAFQTVAELTFPVPLFSVSYTQLGFSYSVGLPALPSFSTIGFSATVGAAGGISFPVPPIPEPTPCEPQ
jgi:RHS repeat-associated protein